KLARDSGTIVVQIGEGSDEIFHGYRLYADHVRMRRRWWEPLNAMPRPLRAAAGRAAIEVALRSGRGLMQAQVLASAADRQLPFWGGAIAYQGRLKELVLSNGHAGADSYQLVERLWLEAEREHPHADLLQKMT